MILIYVSPHNYSNIPLIDDPWFTFEKSVQRKIFCLMKYQCLRSTRQPTKNKIRFSTSARGRIKRSKPKLTNTSPRERGTNGIGTLPPSFNLFFYSYFDGQSVTSLLIKVFNWKQYFLKQFLKY